MTQPDRGTHPITVMDTTLRDGEQTPNVSYTPEEKLQISRLLLNDIEVDRIEIASTRVSEGEAEAAAQITRWARKARVLQRIEILGYADRQSSVDWIAQAGGKVINLLTKQINPTSCCGTIMIYKRVVIHHPSMMSI